jgi:hypothetical protein
MRAHRKNDMVGMSRIAAKYKKQPAMIAEH